jgi:hypothetical protein
MTVRTKKKDFYENIREVSLHIKGTIIDDIFFSYHWSTKLVKNNNRQISSEFNPRFCIMQFFTLAKYHLT